MIDEDRSGPSEGARTGAAILILCAVAAAVLAYVREGWRLAPFEQAGRGGSAWFSPAPFDGPATGVAAWWIGCAAFALCAAWSVRLARVDLAEHRLPNREVLVISSGTAPPLVAAALLAGEAERAGSGLLCAAAVCLPLLLLWVIGRVRGRPVLGAGDVKLAPIVGFVPGWVLADPAGAWLSVFLACVLFGLLGALIAFARPGRRAEFAFGPAMLAAMWFTAFGWPWVVGGAGGGIPA